MFKVYRNNSKKIKALFDHLDLVLPRENRIIDSYFHHKQGAEFYIYQIPNKNKLYIKAYINVKDCYSAFCYYIIYYLPKGYKTKPNTIILYRKNEFLLEQDLTTKKIKHWEHGNYTKESSELLARLAFTTQSKKIKKIELEYLLTNKSIKSKPLYLLINNSRLYKTEYMLKDLIPRLLNLPLAVTNYRKFDQPCTN